MRRNSVPWLNAATLALLAIGFGPTLASAQTADDAAGTILPGYWEYVSRIDILGKTDISKRCVKPGEIDKFLAGPSNRHYQCTYPTRVVGGGRARFDGTCRDKKGRTFGLSATGTYTPVSFTLNARVRIKLAGIPFTPTGSIRAQRISETCPAAPAGS